MTTTWIVGGFTVACLVAVAVWRLRKASATVQRILDQERAATDHDEPEPTGPDTPVHRSGEIER